MKTRSKIIVILVILAALTLMAASFVPPRTYCTLQQINGAYTFSTFDARTRQVMVQYVEVPIEPPAWKPVTKPVEITFPCQGRGNFWTRLFGR